MRARCAVCDRPLRRKRPGEPGPAPTYCSHACRQVMYRARHPLGWKLIAEMGLPDHSPPEMLRQAGVTSA